MYMDMNTGEMYRHVNKENHLCSNFDNKRGDCVIVTAYKMENDLGFNKGWVLNDGSSMRAIRKYIMEHAIEDTIENLKEIMDVDTN